MSLETEKPRENIPLESLNPKFHVSLGGGWLWNKNPGLHMGYVDRKVLFLFKAEDRELLSDCPSVAKIGKNNDTETLGEYEFIGFAYGNRELSEQLISFANQFSKSKLIQGLTDTWGSKGNSTITDL